MKTSIILCQLLLSLCSIAATFTNGDLKYSVIDNTTEVEVTNYIGTDGIVIIPNTVIENNTPYSVTAIADHAFANRDNLTSVTIPNTITKIGTEAFKNCNKLTSITIPSSVTTIGEQAFMGCSGLTNLYVERQTSPPSIYPNTFQSCNYSDIELHVLPGTGSAYTGIWRNFKILDISPPTTTIAATAGSVSITVNSNVTWTAGSSAAWATVDPTSGSGNSSVTVTANTNATNAPRTAKITFTSGSLTLKTVDITQAAASKITLSSSTVEMDASKDLSEITITSNVSWTAVSSASWATVSPTSGNCNGTVKIRVQPNTGAQRTAVITISGGGVTQMVNVTQAAAPPPSRELNVYPSTANFLPAGGTISIAVTANIAWKVTSSDSWAFVRHTQGIYNDTVYVTAAANPGAPRTATITIRGGSIERNITVNQAAVELQVSPETTGIAAAGGSADIWVTSNLEWTARSSASWARVRTTSGSHNGPVTVTAAANSGVPRTATISISGGGFTRQVTITQTGLEFDVRPTTVNIDPAGGSADVWVASNLGWAVSSADAWAVVQPTSGSYNRLVTITAAANPGKPRTTTVTIHASFFTKQITVNQARFDPSSSETVEAFGVWSHGNLLHVRTPHAEQIEIYSLTGHLLYTARKDVGEAIFNLNGLPPGILIVRGNGGVNGWTEKTVHNK
jgi:hypothetical protein